MILRSARDSVNLLHPWRTRTRVASMSVKEVPSDHDFFDPAYVKQWTDSIVRYRPERRQLFEVFAAEAARMTGARKPDLYRRLMELKANADG